MARKAFAGDLIHTLPKGRMEPYRLWFEYLKLAHELVPAQVNKTFYEPWGDVASSDFDDWWKSHWRELFTVPASVSLISSVDEYNQSAEDGKSIVIRVQRHGTRTQKLKDIKEILDGAFGKGSKKASVDPAFEITAKRNVRYDALRQKLRFLQVYEKHKTVEEATKQYMAWALNWNAKLKPRSERKTARPKTIARFSDELDAHELALQKKPRSKKIPAYNTARSDVMKFLKSAENVLHNAAGGKFPGVA